jgi:hypothetical protein
MIARVRFELPRDRDNNNNIPKFNENEVLNCENSWHKKRPRQPKRRGCRGWKSEGEACLELDLPRNIDVVIVAVGYGAERVCSGDRRKCINPANVGDGVGSGIC